MHRIPSSLPNAPFMFDDDFFDALSKTESAHKAVDFFIIHTISRIAGGHPDFARDVVVNLKLESGQDQTRNGFKRLLGQHFYDYVKRWCVSQIDTLNKRPNDFFTKEDFDQYIDLLAAIAAIDSIASLIKPGLLDNQNDFMDTARNDFAQTIRWIDEASRHAIQKLASDCDEWSLNRDMDDACVKHLDTITKDHHDLVRYYSRVMHIGGDSFGLDNFFECLAPVSNRISDFNKHAEAVRPSQNGGDSAEKAPGF